MRVIIREADVEADSELLLDILLRNREHGDNALRRARFNWSFRQNPFGKPRVWLAIDASSSRAIGMVATFPRRLRVDGRTMIAWNGGDTSIDRKFRTLGVALRLRRAVKECVDRKEMPFLYSFPVDRMNAVLDRLGHSSLGRFTRHGLILRAEAILAKYELQNALARPLALAADVVLPVQWSHRFAQNGCHLQQQEALVFDEDFDAFFERASALQRIITIRDAKFLDWRFRQNPLTSRAQLFKLVAGDEMQGYAIIGIEGRAARILDMLVDGGHLTIRTMLLKLIRVLRQQGITTLAIRATESSSLVAEAKPLGFVFQDHQDANVSIYSGDEALTPMILNGKNWYLTQADRDV